MRISLRVRPAIAALAAVIAIAVPCACNEAPHHSAPPQESPPLVKSADASGGKPVRDWSDVKHELADASFELLTPKGNFDAWTAPRIKHLILSAQAISELEYRQFAIPAHGVGGRAITEDNSIFSWSLHSGGTGWVRGPDGSTYYLVCSEGSPPSTRPSGPHETSPVFLPELPTSDDIQEVSLQPVLNLEQGGQLTAESFKRLMSTARPLDPADPSVAGWAYAPWYAGTFQTSDGSHRFELYLGNRGRLMLPDGRVGLFDFARVD